MVVLSVVLPSGRTGTHRPRFLARQIGLTIEFGIIAKVFLTLE